MGGPGPVGRRRHDGAWELPVLGEVAAPAAVLIRPDGHVAWAGVVTDPELPRALDGVVRRDRGGLVATRVSADGEGCELFEVVARGAERVADA